MSSPPETGGHTSKFAVTRGSLAALFFVTALEYGFGLTFRYLIPNVPAAILSTLYLVLLVVAVAGAYTIYRYLPNSKKLVFELGT